MRPQKSHRPLIGWPACLAQSVVGLTQRLSVSPVRLSHRPGVPMSGIGLTGSHPPEFTVGPRRPLDTTFPLGAPAAGPGQVYQSSERAAIRSYASSWARSRSRSVSSPLAQIPPQPSEQNISISPSSDIITESRSSRWRQAPQAPQKNFMVKTLSVDGDFTLLPPPYRQSTKKLEGKTQKK